MSFNFMLNNSSAKLQIKKEVVITKSAAPVRITSSAPRRSQPPQVHQRNTSSTSKHLKVRKASPQVSQPRTKTAQRRSTPSQVTVTFSSDDSDVEEEAERPSKKAKQDVSQDRDLKREIRCRQAFLTEGNDGFSMVHAADITSLDKGTKYIPAFEGASDTTPVALQYPSILPTERFLLVKPKFVRSENNDFNALEDIIHVMRQVIDHYLPDAEREHWDDDQTGYPQRLKRAVNHKSEEEVRNVMEEWNTALQKLVKSGTIAKALDNWPGIHPDLVERILSQACSRTVSLKVTSLKEYENGTDNVYGELLPKFVSKILREETHMKSDQVFVDLGSGVGNCVLQAALEIGCESWGCEMMKNCCNLAELQQAEFEARCTLWGLQPGSIHLERGDFLTNPEIARILPRADVVLVNNKAFTPELNERLTSMFLDLKEGAVVVSLKSFVPPGHKISARNLNSPYNVLDVEEKEYSSACVSWTDAPGPYYVSRKDTSRIRAFAKKNGQQRYTPSRSGNSST